MRRVFWLIVLPALVLAYVASPFRAAWVLRDAIRNADHATIERKVEWDGLRTSLRDSLARHAQLLQEATAAGAEVKPTIWQRVKSAMGGSMLDRFIETYVTPEGLPKLYVYRKVWNEKVRGREDESKLAYTERARRYWARLKRAEFQSLTRVEIEVADRFVPERHYISAFELFDLEWKLVSVRVTTTEPADTSLVQRETAPVVRR